MILGDEGQDCGDVQQDTIDDDKHSAAAQNEASDSLEGDSLPNIEHNKSVDCIFDDDDGRFYWLDKELTITISDDTDRDSVKAEPDDTPLYQNQEGDPEVQKLMWEQNWGQ